MKEIIPKQDLKTLAEMGRALWMDPRECEIATAETVGAITMLNIAPENLVERTASALLERVSRKGSAANFKSNLNAGMKIGQPFYTLLPRERFLLVALHLGRWSYARLARIWGCSLEEIESLAWNARIRLLAATNNGPYPGGAGGGAQCPAYDAKRPWTQRFLDEEVASGRERHLLQNHMMVCDSCREALNRCREAYYRIDRTLPRMTDDNVKDEQMLRVLERVTRYSSGIRFPTELTFVETLEIFTRRWDVRLVLGLSGFALGWKIFGTFF